jgi:hypothetical protein
MFIHSGPLPPLPSRPLRRRAFAYSGTGLEEGVLVITEGSKVDQYLLEWDGGERTWLLAKQTGEPEVYCSQPDRCSCKGFRSWRHCRHSEVLKELVREWRGKNKEFSSGELTTQQESV